MQTRENNYDLVSYRLSCRWCNWLHCNNESPNLSIMCNKRGEKMGNVVLINLEYYVTKDPKYLNNYALDQIELYHTLRGDNIIKDYIPTDALLIPISKFYCSSIFSWTKENKRAIELLSYADDRWEFGGTGFDIYKKLPDEIAALKPKNDYGWLLRGCDNDCEFCVVHQKEGCVHVANDVYDIWDKDKKNKLIKDFSNNILQKEQFFYKISEQLLRENLTIDWNQGLDIRILKEDHTRVLSSLSHAEYHFAFDHPEMKDIIREKVEMLKAHGINRSTFYVICGFYNNPVQTTIDQLMLLKELGQNAYLQPYQPVTKNGKQVKAKREFSVSEQKIFMFLKAWANQHAIFHSMTIEQFLKDSRNECYVKYYKKLGL